MSHGGIERAGKGAGPDMRLVYGRARSYTRLSWSCVSSQKAAFFLRHPQKPPARLSRSSGWGQHACIASSSLRSSQGQQGRAAPERTLTLERNASASTDQGTDGFFSGADWNSLGLHPLVSRSLIQSGLSRPSKAQELAARPLMGGRNVVLAAETGSGKTWAYLAPIMSLLCEGIANGRRPEQEAALILCPNASLCRQVVGFADRLRDSSGQPILRAAHISASSAPPRLVPHILVSTPSALLRAFDEFPVAYGSAWTLASIVHRMRWLVLDEADLLMGGSFHRDVASILAEFRADDSECRVQVVCREQDISLEDFYNRPRHHRKRSQQEVADRTVRLQQEAQSEGSSKSPPLPERRWWRQYIFVAATLPTDNEKSPGARITEVCDNAVWLAGDQLHKSVSSVEHHWIAVTDSAWKNQLQETVKSHLRDAQGSSKTIVFSGTVASADHAAEVLREAGLAPLVFHRDVPQVNRERILEEAALRSDSVIVCTDSAARGIDIPDISHVVQADFASSAVDFIHRVGRTGRAGQPGKVSSLYLPESRHLAQALRASIKSDQPLEGAFSRNRSFGRKIKKYGRYVPRGQNSVLALSIFNKYALETFGQAGKGQLGNMIVEDRLHSGISLAGMTRWHSQKCL